MKRKKKPGRKLLSVLLTLAMAIGLLPGISLTAYSDSAGGGALSGSGTVSDPYIISDAADWETFANNVNNNEDNGAYAGAYYKLADDFDNSDAPITAMVGTEAHPFRGTFDGNGKTLSIDISTSDSGAAPFRYISGATIRNLNVTGSVTGGQHAAAIVGYSKDGNNRIEDCTANTTIGGSGTHVGGILGHGRSSDIAIERCVFSGLMTAGSSARGAIFGWGDEGGTKSITDCLYVMADGQDTSNLDIVKQNKGSVTVTRCYKTTDAGVYGTQVFTAAPVDRIYCQITAADQKQYYVYATTEVKPYYLYTGSDISIEPPVVKNAAGETLTYGTDYSYSPATIRDVGEHTLTVTGMGSYSGSQSLSFIVTDGTVLTSETTALTTGIYKLTGDVTIGSRIEVTGDVTLLLSDGFTLNATKGIHVKSGHSLTINGGANNTGKLNATNVDNCQAGIGGNDEENCGTIIINGGTLDIRGGLQAAGIGGGMNGSGSNITINGGTVTAYGGSESGAGIGGGKFGSGSNITISGGAVWAYGGASDWGELNDSGVPYGTGGAAGIGGGWGGSGSNITISGGSVTAAGGWGHNRTGGGAGIGGGFRGKGSNITISGGSVKPSSYVGAYDIGCGNWGGFAVIPTDGNGNNVYPMVIHNPSGGPISINGKDFPCTHHGSETAVYPFLPNGDHTVEMEGASATYTWDDSAWVVEETFTADGTLTPTSIVSDTTWTIEKGKTITVNDSLSINGGVSLTVVGEGTLNVTAPNGENGRKEGLEKWVPTNGGVAISGGTLIVNGATVNATGGNGGNGIDDEWAAAATGGNGGNAINSNVRIYAGEVNATGGDGGKLGACPDKSATAGGGGSGIAGTLTVNGGTVNATGGNGGMNNSGSSIAGQGGAGIGGAATIKNGTVTATGGTGDSGGNAFGSVPSLAEGSTLMALQAGEDSGSAVPVGLSDAAGKRYAHIEASGEFATGVELSPTSASLRTGMNTPLTAKVLPEGTSANSVAWSSSNEAVATVDSDGLVTGVADGTAIITATATNGTADTSDDFSASCEVTVIGWYPVWVGGEQIWKDVPSGTGWSYNPDSKTLTLSGLSYSGTGYNNSAIYAEGELNIVLTGENTVAITNSTGNGIYVKGNLTIGGEGTLSASGPNFGLFTNGGNITINSGTVTATAEREAAIRSNGGGVLINGGTVTATEPHRGISASNSVQISGGTVVATGTDSSGWGIDCPQGSFTVTGGEFTTSGGSSAINGNPSMTIGKGLAVFAGDEAPGIDVTGTFASSHAQKWVHIISHKHSFTYEAGSGENANTITATCANSDGYCLLPNKQAALTIVAPARTTYGGSESAEATIEGSIDGVENPSIVYKKGDATLSSAPTDAGTYTASITLGEATASVEYTIAKASFQPKLVIQNKTYGGDEIKYTITDNLGGGQVTNISWEKKNSDNDWSSVSDTPKDAGTYRGTATIAETDNYQSATTNTAEFTISKASAGTLEDVGVSQVYTLTGVSASVAGKMPADAGSLTYAKGTASKSGDVTIFNWDVDGSGNVTATLSGGAAGNIITLPVIISSTNYADSTVNVKITLTEKDDAVVSISGAPTSAKTYGDADFTLTGSVTNEGTGTGTWTWSTSDETVFQITPNGANATVKILKAGSATVTAKYESDTTIDTETTATITVNTKTLTITAKDQSIYVGGTVPTLSGSDFYTVTGLVGEETLTINPTLAYQKNGEAATPNPTTAGTYDIVPTGASAGDNYNINYTKATLTISNKGTQTISADNVTVTYGETGKSVSATVTEPATGGGDISYAVKSGDAVTVNENTGALTIVKAGSAVINVTAAENDTYAKATRDVNVTVNKKDVIISGITASSKPYDGNTTATLDTSNATFIGKLDADTLTVTATGTFADKNVGENKTVTISDMTLGGESVGNYQLAAEGQQASTTASITANTLDITAVDYTGTYDGQAHSISVTTEEHGVTITYAETEDGTYSSNNPTYTDAGVHTVYYKAEKTGSTAVSGSKNVAISQKPVTVSGITASGKTYDGNATATLVTTGASFAGKLENDNLTVSATGTFENANVGEGKNVTINGLTLDGTSKENYVLADEGQQTTATANITAKEVGLTWSNTELTYNGEAQKPTATATGLVDGDTCTVTVTGEQTNVGENYTATAESLSNSNYKLPENKTTAFKITKADAVAATVTANNRTYDGSEKPLVNVDNSTLVGGEMQYALGTATEATQPYTTSIPTATDAGTYYVWYKVKGDSSHNDTEAVCIEVEIAKKHSSSQPSSSASSTSAVVIPSESANDSVPVEDETADGEGEAADANDESYTIADFTDLNATAWYQEGVNWALENGIMKGVGDGLFSPNGGASRSMIVTILYRLAGEPETADGGVFTDVLPGSWYSSAIAWVYDKGISSGYGDGHFGPGDSITREQLAAILYRYAQSKGQGFTGMWSFLLDYPDAGEISPWADEAMHWMVMNGIINGKDGLLAPSANVTRAEAATMLMRFTETMAEQGEEA